MTKLVAPALALAAALTSGVTAGYAQQGYEPPLAEEGQTEDGLSLIERGIGSILDNFMTEVEPDLRRLGEDVSGALGGMTPVLEDLSALVDDIKNYQTPERLENGDILIRRRADAPRPPAIGEHLGNPAEPEVTDPDSHDMQPLHDPARPEIEL